MTDHRVEDAEIGISVDSAAIAEQAVVADKAEEAAARLKGRGRHDEAVHPDTDGRTGERFECIFLEAGVRKPTSNARCQVRTPPMASPDHGCVGIAQGRQCRHGRLDVAVADVAEHPACQHDHRRHDAGIRVRGTGIALDDFDAPVELGRMALGNGDIAVIELDEPCDDVGRAVVPLQYAEEVAALAGAHAQDGDGPFRASVERCREVTLHELEPT